jgi:hypothetical protein
LQDSLISIGTDPEPDAELKMQRARSDGDERFDGSNCIPQTSFWL